MSRIALPHNVTAKVRRAESHLQTLRAVLDEFSATQPLVAEPFFSPLPGRAGGWGVRLRSVSSAPTQVPLIVGDFLHNLRSSLDYLARALVQTSGNEPKDGVGGTTFPILDKPKREGELRVKGNVNAEIVAIIESHQPYKAAAGAVATHPLQLLHTLSNIDKHRALHLPLMAAVEPTSMLVALVDPLPIAFIQPTMRPLAAGEDLIMPVAPFPASTKFEVVAPIHPIVALEGAYHYQGKGTVDLVGQLDYMLRTVRDRIIPSFRSSFSGPWPDAYFVFDPVPGPIGLKKRTPEELVGATEKMVEFFTMKYKSDRFLVLGLAPGISA